MAEPLYIILLKFDPKTKSREVYTFAYTDDTERQLILYFGELAENPESSFTWFDAAMCCQKVRDDKRERQASMGRLGG